MPRSESLTFTDVSEFEMNSIRSWVGRKEQSLFMGELHRERLLKEIDRLNNLLEEVSTVYKD